MQALKRARAGFTLIEMVVVITIMAVLAAVAVPVASKVIAYRLRSATREELQALGDASVAYFSDTLVLPTTIGSLMARPTGMANWAGPYLAGVMTDVTSGTSGYEVDAWSRAYTVTVAGDLLTLRSRGENGVSGDTDDLVLATSITLVRRRITIERRNIVNGAIATYNSLYLATSPLPANYTVILQRLVTTSLLPAAAPFATDGWGDAYVADPAGATPVVRIRSIHV